MAIKPFLLATCLSVVLGVQAQDTLTNGLVAYYTFKGDAKDQSGKGNDATPAGNYQFVTGCGIRIIGDFSQFYSGGGHVLLPAFTTNLNSGFTCSIWVKDEVIGVEPVGSEAYVSFQNGTADSTFNTQVTLQNWSPAFVGFDNGNGSGTGLDFRQTINMTSYPSSWKHLVIATARGSFACYLNGTKIYGTNLSYSVFPAPYAALGRHWWPTGSSARMSVTYGNEIFFIQSSPDVINWTNYDGPFLGDGGSWSKTYSARGQPKLFYRVGL